MFEVLPLLKLTTCVVVVLVLVLNDTIKSALPIAVSVADLSCINQYIVSLAPSSNAPIQTEFALRL